MVMRGCVVCLAVVMPSYSRIVLSRSSTVPLDPGLLVLEVIVLELAQQALMVLSTIEGRPCVEGST